MRTESVLYVIDTTSHRDLRNIEAELFSLYGMRHAIPFRSGCEVVLLLLCHRVMRRHVFDVGSRFNLNERDNIAA